jgi:hypothetical protein
MHITVKKIPCLSLWPNYNVMKKFEWMPERDSIETTWSGVKLEAGSA